MFNFWKKKQGSVAYPWYLIHIWANGPLKLIQERRRLRNHSLLSLSSHSFLVRPSPRSSDPALVRQAHVPLIRSRQALTRHACAWDPQETMAQAVEYQPPDWYMAREHFSCTVSSQIMPEKTNMLLLSRFENFKTCLNVASKAKNIYFSWILHEA